MKKLYSFRADTSLLDTLREVADARGVTVTDLMHDFLYEGLRREGIEVPVFENDKMGQIKANSDNSIETLNRLYQKPPSLNSIGETMERKFQELKKELKEEIKAEIDKLCESQPVDIDLAQANQINSTE